jgi:hypothetical protein
MLGGANKEQGFFVGQKIKILKIDNFYFIRLIDFRFETLETWRCRDTNAAETTI